MNLQAPAAMVQCSTFDREKLVQLLSRSDSRETLETRPFGGIYRPESALIRERVGVTWRGCVAKSCWNLFSMRNSGRNVQNTLNYSPGVEAVEIF